MAYPDEWESDLKLKDGRVIHFRPERSSDTEMLWKMYSTLSEATVSNLIPPFTRERIEGWTSNIDYNSVLAIVGVIENDALIVATASLRFNAQEVFKHKAELGITVHDDYQNLGIGTNLLRHLIRIAKEKGLKKVHLTVNVNNTRAIYMYKKAGFEVEGILRREMHLKGKYIDEQRMAIFL